MKPAVEYDAVANTAYIRFSQETVLERAQVTENIILDYDEHGHILGMEILDARTYLAPATLKNAA